MASGYPVEAGDDAGPAAGAVAVEHAHRHDGRCLRDPVGSARHRSGDVGSVAVAVDEVAPVGDRREAAGHAAGEVGVIGAHAGVDDVCSDACACGAVRVAAVERELLLVDAVQAPRGRCLGLDGQGHPVRLDERDVRVLSQRDDLEGRCGDEHPGEHVRVGSLDGEAVGLLERGLLAGCLCHVGGVGTGGELHDVVAEVPGLLLAFGFEVCDLVGAQVSRARAR